MAGFANGFDQGGAIPDDDQGESWQPDTDDNSGALPVASSQAPDDNSGALPVVDDGQQQQQPQSRSGVDFNAAHVPANAKRIIQYLMGGDAAPPQVAEKFEQGVKAENPGISQDDANLIAVHKAGELGGPAAAFAMIQYNRSAYNAKQSFAKAALNGIDGKAGDMNAAALAATQASQHILDGSQTVFTAQPHGGFTATVKLPGTDRRLSFNLSPQQFSRWVDVGHDGLWDKVMEEGGVPTSLQRLAAQGNQAQDQDQDQSQDQSDDDRGTQPSEAVRTGKAIARDVTQGDQPALPGTHDKNGHYLGPRQDAPDQQFDPALEARADSMFGKGKVYNPERTDWMSKQENEQQKLQNQVDVAKTKADAYQEVANTRAGGQVEAANARAGGQVEAAKVRADGYAKAQQEKAKLALQKMSQQARDANERNRINVATRLINNPNWATQSADERNAILKKYGLDQLMEPVSPSTQVQTQTPQAAAPQQQGGGQAPARLKLPDGKYYIKGPDGKAMLDPNQ